LGKKIPNSSRDQRGGAEGGPAEEKDDQKNSEDIGLALNLSGVRWEVKN
jgi:hypothetical protein